MNDVLKTMPEMYMGQALDDRLCILPEYDEEIRHGSIPERLIALQDIYQKEMLMQKYNLEEAMEVLGGNDFDRE